MWKGNIENQEKGGKRQETKGRAHPRTGWGRWGEPGGGVRQRCADKCSCRQVWTMGFFDGDEIFRPSPLTGDRWVTTTVLRKTERERWEGKKREAKGSGANHNNSSRKQPRLTARRRLLQAGIVRIGVSTSEYPCGVGHSAWIYCRYCNISSYNYYVWLYSYDFGPLCVDMISEYKADAKI